jgi:hypothetical protein
MVDLMQDCFVVVVRDDFAAAERVVAICPSHEEAAQLRQQLRRPGRNCIIRCVSQTGGGD